MDSADLVRRLPRVRPVTAETHEAGLALAARYEFSVYNAMILASAAEAGCAVLWSAGFQDGLRVEGGLRVRNPFRA